MQSLLANKGLCASNLALRPKPAVCAKPCALKSVKPSCKRLHVVAQSSRSAALEPSLLDRVLAAIPYVLPFCDAVQYGRYLFHAYPGIRQLMAPTMPLISAYHNMPFSGFVAFFALYLGVVNNTAFSRFVRFNAMQAMLLDVLLVLPRLIESVLPPPAFGWGAQLYTYSQSFVWVFTTAWVVYGIGHCLAGFYGRIPFVADSADQQVR